MKSQDFKKNLLKSFKEVGLKKKDNVYLGVNLGQTFENYKNEIFNKKKSINNNLRELCSKKILNVLKEYVGKEGTIIVPAFNFDFYQTKKFNPKSTPSTLGFFENFFLKQKSNLRSSHPIFSVAASGKNQEKLTESSGLFSFGYNSPFNLFTKFNVKFLNLGISFGNTCTYVHHLEHLNGVNHRYYKPVIGKIIINGKKKNQTYYSLVRYHSIKATKAEFKIENYLRRKKKINETKKYKIYVSLISSIDVFNFGMSLLNKNPSYFMSKKTVVKVND
jgi:aminoglycoside 3-N-acetyltransferase